MEYDLYDMDLSLFGGDLLVGLPPTSAELKVTQDVQESTVTSTPWASDLQMTLGQDELADSISLSTPGVDQLKDLAWMDSRVDLLNLLAQEGEHALVKNTTTSDATIDNSALSTIQSLADETTQLLVAGANDHSQLNTDMPAVAQAVDNLVQSEIQLEDGGQPTSVDQLLDMLSTSVDPAVVDDLVPVPTAGHMQFSTPDILSPVSADEVESLLSSAPPSPSLSSSLFDGISTAALFQKQELKDTTVVTHSELTPDQSNSLLAQYLTGHIEIPSTTINKTNDILPSFDPDLDSISSGSISGDDDPDYLPESWHVNTTRGTPYSKTSKTKTKKTYIKKEDRELNRKLRKKQQNKDAATRYRIKKRQEASLVDDECSQLEDKNKKLKDTVDQMTREIGYLKNLLAEVYKAKGLLKPKGLGK